MPKWRPEQKENTTTRFREVLLAATTNIPAFHQHLHKVYVDDQLKVCEELPRALQGRHPPVRHRRVQQAGGGRQQGRKAPVQAPREWQQQERRRRKLIRGASWYRPADAVLFLPVTPDSELASLLRPVVEEEGRRLGLAIRVGLGREP